MPTNTEIMCDLQELPHRKLDAGLRKCVADIEQAGAHVTFYEVKSTGAILIINSTTEKPSAFLIRDAYEKHLLEKIGGTA